MTYKNTLLKMVGIYGMITAVRINEPMWLSITVAAGAGIVYTAGDYTA